MPILLTPEASSERDKLFNSVSPSLKRESLEYRASLENEARRGRGRAATRSNYTPRARDRLSTLGKLGHLFEGLDLPLDDVADSIDTFASQQAVVRAIGLRCPVIQVRSDFPVVVDIFDTLLTAPVRTAARNILEVPQHVLRAALESAPRVMKSVNLPLTELDVEEAAPLFAGGISRFLSSRLRGFLRESIQPSSLDPPSHDLIVHTQESQWQVLVTQDFFMRRRIFGGSLSTPVKGALFSGNYVFGGRRQADERWERYSVTIPTDDGSLTLESI